MEPTFDQTLARLRLTANAEATDFAAGRDAFNLVDRVAGAGGPAQRLAVEAQRKVADAVIGLVAGAVWAAADLDEKALGGVVGAMWRMQQLLGDLGRARQHQLDLSVGGQY